MRYVKYDITFDDTIGTAIGQSKVGPFSFRLVLLNDPAVGHWQVFNDFGRGTHFSEGMNSAAVTDVLDQAGHKVEQDFLSSTKTAQQQVYSEWEKSAGQ